MYVILPLTFLGITENDGLEIVNKYKIKVFSCKETRSKT